MHARPFPGSSDDRSAAVTQGGRIAAAVGIAVFLFLILVAAAAAALVTFFTGGLFTPAAAEPVKQSAYSGSEVTCEIAGGIHGDGLDLDAAQAANAAVIHQVAVDSALPAQASVIALATAIQESNLYNLDYGDRDSLGLFQQRPSQGWGTPAQVMNPAYAATQFYRHLQRVPDWWEMPLWKAANAVQRSAYPSAYEKWHQDATVLEQFLDAHPHACSQSQPS